MKKIYIKTEKEMYEESIKHTETTPKKRGMYFVSCEKCKIAFFEDDKILKLNDGSLRCPNMRKNIVGKNKLCFNRLLGGSENIFNQFYKIIE